MSTEYTYNPRIVVTKTFLDEELEGGVLDLTRGFTPITQFSEGYSADVKYSAIPLRDGVTVYYAQKNPAVLTVQGMMHCRTQDAILAKKQTLRRILIGLADRPNEFAFYRYYDDVNNIYRWWTGCYIVGDLQFSNTARTVGYLPYAFTFEAPDGMEYTEG